MTASHAPTATSSINMSMGPARTARSLCFGIGTQSMLVHSFGNQIDARRPPMTFNMKVSCILTSDSMQAFYHLHGASRPPVCSLDPCIGVILLVLSLEFLRQLGKEYDYFLAHQYRQYSASQTRNLNVSDESLNGCIDQSSSSRNGRYAHSIDSCQASRTPSSNLQQLSCIYCSSE
jgi:hypothetical protein